MRGHYDDSVRMRQAIVAGKLQDFQRVAGRMAEDDWSPRLRPGYVPFVSSMRDVASHARTASSLVTGAMDLGKLGDACAACHVKFGGPSGPIEPTPMDENTDATMFDHALATDLLWDGLILPSDSSWSMGASIILEAPPLASDAPEVATAAEHLRSLARDAVAAEAPERAQVFGNLLLTCAACHEQVGISIASPLPAPQ